MTAENSTTVINLVQHDFLLSTFGKDYDQSYIPTAGGYIGDYSGVHWFVVLEKENRSYLLEYCDNPGCDGTGDLPVWELQEISDDVVMQYLEDWKDFLDV